MATAYVGPSLTPIFRFKLRGYNSFSCDLFNTGDTNPFSAFQVKLYSNEDSPGVVWFDTGVQWTAIEDGSTMRGVSDGVDPTTLAAGANMSFTVIFTGAYESVEFLASGETTAEVYLGRGNN